MCTSARGISVRLDMVRRTRSIMPPTFVPGSPKTSEMGCEEETSVLAAALLSTNMPI